MDQLQEISKAYSPLPGLTICQAEEATAKILAEVNTEVKRRRQRENSDEGKRIMAELEQLTTPSAVTPYLYGGCDHAG